MIPLGELLDRMVAIVRDIVEEKNPGLSVEQKDQVAEAVGVGAILFWVQSRRRSSNIVFDWKLATDPQGDTGPYVQYTHARAASILRKHGGDVPKKFIPYVEDGVKESMGSGPVNGYPVIDVKVLLVGGSTHEVDSTELAYRIAAGIAFSDGVKKAAPAILEPIMDIEVVLPIEYVGDVLNDISMRRGKVEGMLQRAQAHVISARAPLSDMFGYATSLRSLTQGRAIYSMQFSHYDRLPPEVAAEKLGHIPGLVQ